MAIVKWCDGKTRGVGLGRQRGLSIQGSHVRWAHKDTIMNSRSCREGGHRELLCTKVQNFVLLPFVKRKGRMYEHYGTSLNGNLSILFNINTYHSKKRGSAYCFEAQAGTRCSSQFLPWFAGFRPSCKRWNLGQASQQVIMVRMGCERGQGPERYAGFLLFSQWLGEHK